MKVVGLVVALGIFISIPGPVFAQARISPSSPLFFLKAVRENIELSLALTKQVRRIRTLEFAGRRLREVNSLIGTPDEPLIESSLLHYRKLTGDLDKLTTSGEDLKVWAAEGEGEHLNTLLDDYPKISDRNAKGSVLATIEVLESHNRALAGTIKDSIQKRELIDRIATSQARTCNFYAQRLKDGNLNDVNKTILAKLLGKCNKAK